MQKQMKTTKEISTFLSIVVLIRNTSEHIEKTLRALTNNVKDLVEDYEIIIVDNASSDGSIETLRKLTSRSDLPNLQVFALTKEVKQDVGFCVGLDSALGDYCCFINPSYDSVDQVSQLLTKAIETKADVVFAKNIFKGNESTLYKLAEHVFNKIFRLFNGIQLTQDAPTFRLMSRSVINFLLMHGRPSQAYRHLPALSGFAKEHIIYNSPLPYAPRKKLHQSIDRGIRLLTSTTQGPMRIITTLSIFGAGANLIYSLYVLLVGIFKNDIAPGWISLSLQQSGMFFLISLVLWILGEYILNMADSNNDAPDFYVAQEFTSNTITRNQKLNLEEQK